MAQIEMEWPTLDCADARADGGRRQVTLGRHRVLIRRVRENIRMNIGVPARSYRGVVFETSADGFRVGLRHDDEDLGIVLNETVDEREAFAHLQYWGEYFALPLFVSRDGSMTCIRTRVGTMDCAPPTDHGRGACVPAARRGRFARRRKTGIVALANIVHAGEREIVARN